MGCFVACFRSTKDVNGRKQRRKVQPRQNRVNATTAPVQESSSPTTEIGGVSGRSLSPILKPRDKSEEQQLSSSTRKRVTFDSNVKTYELNEVYEETDVFLQKCRKNEEEEEEEKDMAKIQQCSVDSSSIDRAGSYPPNHRYQNCRDSDDDDGDEDEVLDYVDSDREDDDDDIDDEEYSDFSDDEDGITDLSGKSYSAQEFTAEAESCFSSSGFPEETILPVGLKRYARERNGDVHSVLKPVENISQWRAVKVKGRTPSNTHKENLELSNGHKTIICQPKGSDKDIAVDASLSNWLSSSETTPPSKITTSISNYLTPESQGSNSLKSLEDRPILGALTMEELKQFSTLPSPRRSPCKSHDEMQIIGSVGTSGATLAQLKILARSLLPKEYSNSRISTEISE